MRAGRVCLTGSNSLLLVLFHQRAPSSVGPMDGGDVLVCTLNIPYNDRRLALFQFFGNLGAELAIQHGASSSGSGPRSSSLSQIEARLKSHFSKTLYFGHGVG